jgi:hypothetical protein
MSVDDINLEFYRLVKHDYDIYLSKCGVEDDKPNEAIKRNAIMELYDDIISHLAWTFYVDVSSLLSDDPKIRIYNNHSRFDDYILVSDEDYYLSMNDSFDLVKEYHIRFVRLILRKRIGEICYVASYSGLRFVPDEILLDKFIDLMKSGIEECQKHLSIKFSKIDIADKISEHKKSLRENFDRDIRSACKNLFEIMGPTIDEDEVNYLINRIVNEELAKRGTKAFF